MQLSIPCFVYLTLYTFVFVYLYTLYHDKCVHPATSGFEALPEQDAIYAFHYYSAPCNSNLSAYLNESLARRLGAFSSSCRGFDIRATGAVPPEFNLGAGDISSEAAMADTLNQFELRSISFTGWQLRLSSKWHLHGLW